MIHNGITESCYSQDNFKTIESGLTPPPESIIIPDTCNQVAYRDRKRNFAASTMHASDRRPVSNGRASRITLSLN